MFTAPLPSPSPLYSFLPLLFPLSPLLIPPSSLPSLSFTHSSLSLLVSLSPPLSFTHSSLSLLGGVGEKCDIVNYHIVNSQTTLSGS